MTSVFSAIIFKSLFSGKKNVSPACSVASCSSALLVSLTLIHVLSFARRTNRELLALCVVLFMCF